MIPINTLLIYPTIIIHGIGGNTHDLSEFKNSLENYGVGVYNIEIGNGKVDSIIWNMNKQCKVLSENIDKLNIQSNKINIIGISQGGLLARCYVEKYSHCIKKVHSLITYGTPHMGIYNLWIQLKKLDYWKNPYKYLEYLEDNDFLVYLNNDIIHLDMELYKSNMISLDYFLIVWSNLDKVITPLESAKFEFYNISDAVINRNLKIIDFKNSTIFLKDTLGLRYLYENNKMKIKQYDCNHDEFKKAICYNKKFDNQDYSLLNVTITLL